MIVQPGTTAEMGVSHASQYRALDWLRQDLQELGFGVSTDHWPRWMVCGFYVAIRLAAEEPRLALPLLEACRADPEVVATTRIALRQLQRVPLGATANLSPVREIFSDLLATATRTCGSSLGRLSLEQELSRWLRHVVGWGLQAGLNADALFVGGLLSFYGRLVMCQQFIADRLLSIVRAPQRSRRETLIELIAYSYPDQPTERAFMVSLAKMTLASLAQRGEALNPGDWILAGFREGRGLSARDSALRGQLFAEATPPVVADLLGLFKKRLGANPAQVRPQRLVAAALGWLQEVHPHAVRPNCRALEYERLRHLFDFSVWMGVVAGVSPP